MVTTTPPTSSMDKNTFDTAADALISAVFGSPRTIETATYTQAAGDNYLIANYAGTVTLTLLNPVNYFGSFYVKTITANAVISASSNVVPLGGSTNGTAIVAATAGKWIKLVSDGKYWIAMAGG